MTPTFFDEPQVFLSIFRPATGQLKEFAKYWRKIWRGCEISVKTPLALAPDS